MRASIAADVNTRRHKDPAIVDRFVAVRQWSVFWVVPRVVAGWLWLAAGWSIARTSAGEEWPTRLTAVGLTVVGIALILGLVTGIAAFFAILFGVSLDAGGSGVVAVSMLLVVAWKTAGWIGMDRWVLPFAGAPWEGAFPASRQEWLAETVAPEQENTG